MADISNDKTEEFLYEEWESGFLSDSESETGGKQPSYTNELITLNNAESEQQTRLQEDKKKVESLD